MGIINEKYALLSVYDKTGIIDFAKVLSSLNYKIISTGGTAKVLTENGIGVIPIQQITGNPESFDGRMKTISFQIESGILFNRNNPSHVRQARKLKIKPIDIVVCNLYPFEKTVSKKSVLINDAIESIDVGGPTMIRAAAKNFKNVLVIVDPNDYKSISLLLHSGGVSEKVKKELAAKAFSHLSFYDSQIAYFLKEELFTEEVTIPGRKMLDLRYGENPHQKSAFYVQPNSNSILENLKHLWGRDLSLVNVIDINAGIEAVRLFKENAAAVIKHANPCGIALGKSIAEALKRAIDADPESAFGGIVVLNKEMDLNAAKIIGEFKDERKSNVDIVAIPEITKDALEYLKKLRKSMGIYTFDSIHKLDKKSLNIKFVDGGFILQSIDKDIDRSFSKWRVVTKVKPAKKQLEQMKIGWKFISRTKSNSIIIIDRDLPMTRGIGSGQTSRFRSTQIALKQAGKYAKGAILVSDSFFPFDDTIKLAAKYQIAGIVQQGGSVNDKMSIDTANRLKIPMVFTNRRAFWH
ncbi:MAG: bifunctional phosphoribosylaminoimidazolecarboxamide formyltransferase/IMP cyclohydrolase [Patescibacteria group bacterium]|nr:bifunctional phosphoribosylaminoimidazolecarboxamide formyltransferase/IMP cyclohydrolase [Patescibacteria group bacterium]